MINETTAKKIKAGATVRVFEKLQEGDKAQIRRFEGLVLARKHGSEQGSTFTVRSTVAGVGVEKVFPLHSPTIDRVEVLSSPRKVSRSKIYYVRNLARKALRKKTAISAQSQIAGDDREEKPVAEEPAEKEEPAESAPSEAETVEEAKAKEE